MTLTSVVDEVASSTGLPRSEVRKVVDETLKAIFRGAVTEGKVLFQNFGKFVVVKRTFRNSFGTGKTTEKQYLKFKPASWDSLVENFYKDG